MIEEGASFIPLPDQTAHWELDIDNPYYKLLIVDAKSVSENISRMIDQKIVEALDG